MEIASAGWVIENSGEPFFVVPIISALLLLSLEVTERWVLATT